MKRRPKTPYSRYPEPPISNRRGTKTSSFLDGINYTLAAICAGIFILGIGVGIALSSGQTTTSSNVASREVIDRSAPNAELCVQYGASAIVSDMRVFVTLNPFNVYVTQPRMRPGCVLRRNNWSILEQRRLIGNEQVRECKNRMNTFGFIGSLDSSPQIDCIYQNDSAGNLFLNPEGAKNPQETEQF
jgi:hypothetical protein